MIGCIIVAEGDCDGEVYEFATQAEADAFCRGVSEGADHYGCGSCAALTLNDLEHLNPDDKSDAKDIAFIEEYLPVIPRPK